MQFKLKILSLAVALLMTACGGGSDNPVSSAPNPNVPQPAPENPNPQPPITQEQIINTVNLEDISTEITAASFGLTDWTPRAISIDQDILYIGDSYPSQQILRYDLKNKKILPKIELNGLTRH